MRYPIALLLLFGACAPRVTVKTASPDLGVIEGGVYREEFFGLSMPIPGDWEFEPREALNRMLGQAKTFLPGKGQEADQVRDVMDAAMKQMTPLAAAGRKVAADAPMALVLVAAMRLPPSEADAPLDKALEDGVAMMQAGGVKVKALMAPHAVSVGGQRAYAMEYGLEMPDGVLRETAHVMSRKGFAVYVFELYESDAGRDLCQGVLDKISFK